MKTGLRLTLKMHDKFVFGISKMQPANSQQILISPLGFQCQEQSFKSDANSSVA